MSDIDSKVEQLEAQVLDLSQQVEQLKGDADVLDRESPMYAPKWSGIIRVAGKKWGFADITGTASGYVKVYFDGTTAPAYATFAEYDASQYPDTYEIFDVATQQGDIHVVRA